MTLSNLIKSKMGAFLIIIPFIKPASEITGSFDIVFDLWKMIASIIIFCCCCFNSKWRWSTSLLSLVIIQIIYFVSTVAHMGELSAAVVQMVSNIALCVYLDYLFKFDEYVAIRNFCYPTFVMALLTTITMFVYYPNGMYQISGENYVETSNYLWGFDNTSGMLFIPTMFFLIVYSMYVDKKKIYLITVLALLFFSSAFFYVDAKTSFFMMLVIVLSYIFIVVLKMKFNMINAKTVFLTVIIGFIILLVFNNKMDFLWNYARRVDKYYSLKARFIFWQKELEYFAKSPIVGYGLENKTKLVSKIYIDHPHNFFMDLMYRGGIMAIIMLICFIISITKGKMIKDRISKITCVCVGALLIMVMMDFYNDVYLIYPELYFSYLLLKKRKYVLSLNSLNKKRCT